MFDTNTLEQCQGQLLSTHLKQTCPNPFNSSLLPGLKRHILYPCQTGLTPCSPQTQTQTHVWGEQWMTFLGNPYVNTRYGQYALSYRLSDLGIRYCGNLSGFSSIYTCYCVIFLENLVNDYLLECLLFIRIFHYRLQQNENEYNRLPLL